MAAPTPIPRNPDNSVQDLRWADPSGVITEPSSGRKDTGWLPLDVVTEGEMNWLNSKPLEADRALISQCIPSSSGWLGSWIYRGTTTPLAGNGTWSDTGQPPLFGFLSDAAGVNTVTVDLWIDPEGNGATGIQARQSSVTPFLFTSTRDHYFFVDLTQSIASVTAGITVIDVPVGDPQPATPVGTVPVWRVETDATGIVDQEILIPEIPILKTIGIEELTLLGDLSVNDVSLNGTMTVESGATIDVLSGGTIMADPGSTCSLSGTVIIGGTGTFTCIPDATFSNDVTLGDSAGDVITVNGTTTFAADVFGPGVALTFSTVNASTLSPTLTEYPSTVPNIANGTAAFGGRNLTLGDASTARRVHTPTEVYVISDDTNAGPVDITDASITMDIGDAEAVELRVSAIQSEDVGGVDVRILLSASNGVDNVAVLNGSQDDIAQLILPTSVAADDRRPTGFTVRWVPTNDVVAPDNTTWTIQVRHATSGGTLTTTNVKLEGYYA